MGAKILALVKNKVGRSSSDGCLLNIHQCWPNLCQADSWQWVTMPGPNSLSQSLSFNRTHYLGARPQMNGSLWVQVSVPHTHKNKHTRGHRGPVNTHQYAHKCHRRFQTHCTKSDHTQQLCGLMMSNERKDTDSAMNRLSLTLMAGSHPSSLARHVFRKE